MLVFGQPVLSKVIAIAKAQNVTSISELIAARCTAKPVARCTGDAGVAARGAACLALQLKAVGKKL